MSGGFEEISEHQNVAADIQESTEGPNEGNTTENVIEECIHNKETGTERISDRFRHAHEQNRLAFLTFIPNGFPRLTMSAPLLLALEKAGSDIIEVGIPFSDPVADGPTIQNASLQALNNGASISTAFQSVKEARSLGLKAAVIFMSYWNPFLTYGIDRLCRDAVDYGVDGFLVVDLPIDEAVNPLPSFADGVHSYQTSGLTLCDNNDIRPSFVSYCHQYSLGFVPMISPTTPFGRVAKIIEWSNSFVYCVCLTGVTGALSVVEWKSRASKGLHNIFKNVREAFESSSCSREFPRLVVGFGIASAEQVKLLAESVGIDGFVIGSAMIDHMTSTITTLESHAGVKKKVTQLIKRTFSDIFEDTPTLSSRSLMSALGPAISEFCLPLREASHPRSSAFPSLLSRQNSELSSLPSSTDWFYGSFGGRFIPETLMKAHEILSDEFHSAIKDPQFLEDVDLYRRQYIGGPTPLHYARRLTEKLGGAKIFLKREDMAYTGAHKINNAIGQALLAIRLGKQRIIAETGAGQHGVAVATACALFGLECVIYMGEIDMERQKLNVLRMNILGAKVIPVIAGSRTLKDAVNEALRDWVTNPVSTYYLVGSAVGPDPFPKIVKYFQSVIGNEARQQMLDVGSLPDVVVACVGGGSNAIGTFSAFIDDQTVRLVGVEGGGKMDVLNKENSVETLLKLHSSLESIATQDSQGEKKQKKKANHTEKRSINCSGHSATLCKGTPGVFHGAQTYLIQDDAGQIMETYSISAGLNYPGVGPELAYLKDIGRAEFTCASDNEALEALMMLASTEGIIAALESSHAVAWAVKNCQLLGTDKRVLITISGRGDKDVSSIASALKESACVS